MPNHILPYYIHIIILLRVDGVGQLLYKYNSSEAQIIKLSRPGFKKTLVLIKHKVLKIQTQVKDDKTSITQTQA